MVEVVLKSIRIPFLVLVYLVLSDHYVVILVKRAFPKDRMSFCISTHRSFSDITTTITSITQNPNAPCAVNPCFNRAFCLTVSGGGFRCVCTTGYTGRLCDYPGSLLMRTRGYRSFYLKNIDRRQVVVYIILV